MTLLRALTEEGMKRFQEWIEDLRAPTEEGKKRFQECLEEAEDFSELNIPDLNRESFSGEAELEKRVEVDGDKSFQTRMELGRYMTEILRDAGIRRSDVFARGNYWTRIWSWLAYLWLDQFCRKPDGTRYIYEPARYVCSTAWNRYYRHFVAGPYYIYSLHGEEGSKLFLDCPISVHWDIVERLASRQRVISNKKLIRAAHALFWNPETKSPKTGAADKKKPGTAERLAKDITNQLALTYDLHSMQPRDILDLLPSEFDRWWKNSDS